MDLISCGTRIELSNEPLIFKKLVKWDILEWSIDQWKAIFANDTKPQTHRIRKGSFKCSQKPIWERNCVYEDMTMEAFFTYFSHPNPSLDWLYFDYKHISKLGESPCSKLDFTWKDVGFSEKSAEDSTIWIGTSGAHTPCHQDTYGCNFVAQIYGKKRWLLFPPSESINLKPVRVPYEESSVYSSFNFFRGCARFPDVKDAFMVDLEPGDVLYVPSNWWHYVENITSAISVNTWIPLESDNESRIKEALVKFFINSTLSDMDSCQRNQLLNPNEDDLTDVSAAEIIDQLNWCIRSSANSKTPTKEKMDDAFKHYQLPRRSIDQIQQSMNVSHECYITPPERNASVDSLKLINAFCHPDVINLVKQKLIQEL